MLRDTARQGRKVLRGAMELRVGRERWCLSQATGAKKLDAEGRTADLQFRLETTAVINGEELMAVVLEEGVFERRVGENLRPVKQEWLLNVLNGRLSQCKDAFSSEIPLLDTDTQGTKYQIQQGDRILAEKEALQG